MTPPSTVRLGPRAALTGVLTLLVAANLIRSSVLPGPWHFTFNVAIGGASLLLAWSAGLSARQIGLDRTTAPAGMHLGLRAFVAVTAVVVLAGALGLLDDDRVEVGWAEMVLRTLVVIPIGTVLVEELAFRCVLHGLLSTRFAPRVTIAAGAVLFGLWHVFPASRDDSAAAIVGVFVATTAAGAGFAWLRARSGSLLAPLLAHLATNSTTFAIAWAFS